MNSLVHLVATAAPSSTPVPSSYRDPKTPVAGHDRDRHAPAPLILQHGAEQPAGDEGGHEDVQQQRTMSLRWQVRWDRDSGRWFAFVLLACAVVSCNRL
jgi:hypothetical protein